MPLHDWELPPGVDRGLWDYLHSTEMVGGYDEQIAQSHLVLEDTAFCVQAFLTPGRLVDLGCGTGRLCLEFARRGFDCTGIDLSEEMLARARDNAEKMSVNVKWLNANLVEAIALPPASFDYAACLFSTLGMVRGSENRGKLIANALTLLKPGGKLVLHVHNRWFHRLGIRQLLRNLASLVSGNESAGDITMPQSYGGAPLTLHHFSRGEIVKLLKTMRIESIAPIGLDSRKPPGFWNSYGYLILASATSA